jgi:hypothetical protein
MSYSKYITKAVLFFIPLLLILIFLEYTVRKIPNDYSYKHTQLLQKSDSIETLILGGSHTAYDINPAYLSSTYNLAYVSQSLYFDKELFNKFSPAMPRLKNIVLMMAYPTLSHKMDEGEESWRKYNYYRYYQLKPLKPTWINRHYPEILKVPLKRNINRWITYHKGSPVLTSDENGWLFNYTPDPEFNLEKNAPIAFRRHENGSMDFTENLLYLKEIIDSCKSRHIKVFIITTPLYPAYFRLLNPAKFNKMVSTCEDLERTYSGTVFYTDFHDDIRINPADFYDTDHLNTSGAVKFSRIVNALIASANP